MSWPEITGWSSSELIAFLPASRPLISIPRPSIVGAIPQISGATARIPGMRLRSSAIPAGKWLKTGLGTFSRRMIIPSIRLRVSPTRSLRPFDRQKSPSTPRIGIDRPIRARTVRIGRVSRLRQANIPMSDSFQAGQSRLANSRRLARSIPRDSENYSESSNSAKGRWPSWPFS